MRSKPCSIDPFNCGKGQYDGRGLQQSVSVSAARVHRVKQASIEDFLRPLVFGNGRQLSDDFLQARSASFVGARCHGRGSLLGRVTVIQVAKVSNFTSEGHNVSQHIGGIHTY
jgi:hypothetical protein